MSYGMKVRYKGVCDTLAGHARRLGLSVACVYKRYYKYGLETRKARKLVFEPVRFYCRDIITYQGITATRREHAERLGIPAVTMKRRVRTYGPNDYERLFAPLQRHNGLIPDAHGRMATRREHAARYGIPYELLVCRLTRYRKGEISYARVFSTFIRKPNDDSWKIRITYNGITDTVSGWAKRSGLPKHVIRNRLRRFGRSKRALDRVFKPYNYCSRHIYITYRGQTLTATGWGKKLGIDSQRIIERLRKGATPAQALYKGHWRFYKAKVQPAKGNHTRRKLAALGIFA